MADRTAGNSASGEPASGGATANTLLRMFYVTQVYSVESFAHMLATYEGLTADHRRKLEACRRLALAISLRLRLHMTMDLGLDVKPPARARQAARTLATQQTASWTERMTELEQGAYRGVTAARALKALYGAHQPNLCATLLAHEMALRDFARDELDGEGETSLAGILALLGPDDRAAIAAFAG
jgi:hypothetical protein